MMGRLVSVVVLAFNKAEYTARCLDALTATLWRPLEVVLVNNGSTDGTAAVFDDFAARAGGCGITVKLVRNETNHGAATGRNQALALASGRLVAFLDNDVVVRSRDWVKRLSEVLDSGPRVGIAGAKLVYPVPPYPIQCAGVAVSRSGRIFFRGRGEARGVAEFNRVEEVQCLISACWLMRREVCEEIGLLDEAYNPVQFEDLDYCYRARARGWQVFYVPLAEMYHFESVTTSGTAVINSPYQIVKNGLLFKSRWRGMFARESGPPDDEWLWVPISPVSLNSIGELEQVGGVTA